MDEFIYFDVVFKINIIIFGKKLKLYLIFNRLKFFELKEIIVRY